MFNVYAYSDRYNITHRTAEGPAACVPWLNDSDHLYLEQRGKPQTKPTYSYYSSFRVELACREGFPFGICQMNEIH